MTDSHVSPSNPLLQVAWDSTSLGALMQCPRYYQYAILEGWGSGDNADLAFGGYFASACERYQKGRIAGLGKDDTILSVVKWLLAETWNPDGSQWGGTFVNVWKCAGDQPFKNPAGRRAKCPYSFKATWIAEDYEPAPDHCKSCRGSIITARQYVPDHKQKNRVTLLRLAQGWMDEQPDDFTTAIHPYVFPDGTAAVELSFRLPLGRRSPYGDDYLLCGHIDYLGQEGATDTVFPVDNKTTTHSLDKKFFQSYSPNYQFDTYDLAASLLWPDLDMPSIMIDAAQTTINGVDFGRQHYYKTEAQREEHLKTINYWIGQAEQFAADGYFPMNKRQCWHCPFAGVCSKDPAIRESELRARFEKRTPWNPLQER